MSDLMCAQEADFFDDEYFNPMNDDIETSEIEAWDMSDVGEVGYGRYAEINFA